MHSAARSWFQSFALLVGLSDAVKGPAVVQLWQACMRETQSRFDRDAPVHWEAFATNAISPSPSLSVPVSVSASVSPSLSQSPLYTQSLWDDVLRRKRESERECVALPDLSQSVLLQKLQMMHFCLEMKSESAVFEFPHSGREQGLLLPKLFRRVPVTSDVLALQQHIVNKFHCSGSGSGTAGNASHCEESESSSSSSSSVAPPPLPLQVRLPSLVSDMNCFRCANRDADLRSFCSWYGLLDAVNESEREGEEEDERDDETHARQHARAMALPAAERIDETSILQSLESVWREQSAPLSCDQQKSLFSAEKELGKAIAYLDRLSAVDFAFQLVFEAIVWIREAFLHVVCRYVGSTALEGERESELGVFALLRRFERLFEELQEHQRSRFFVSATAQRATQSNGSGSSGASAQGGVGASATPSRLSATAAAGASPSPLPSPFPTSSNSQSLQELQSPAALSELFHLVDEIAGEIEKIELSLAKLVQLSPVADSLQQSASAAGDRLGALAAWLSSDCASLEETYTLRSEEEVKALRATMKTIHNRNGRGHDWHSYDGRELGLPQRKEFNLRSFTKCTVAAAGTACVTPVPSSAAHSRSVSKASAEDECLPVRLEFTEDSDSSVKDVSMREKGRKDASAADAENEDIRVFELFAVTDGNMIRTTYTQVEKD